MKLGDICSVQSGGTPKRSKAEYWVNGNIPWVKISDIKGQFLSETEEKITEEGLANSSAKVFQKGTILYTIFATLGEVCILNIEAATNQAIAGLSIKTKELCPEYLYYFLCAQKEQINKVGRGVAQNNINLTILRDIEINLPTRPEQKRIAVILEQNDKLINLRKKQLQELDNIIKSRFIEMFGDPVSNNFNWKQMILREVISKIGSGATPRGGKESYQAEGITLIRSMNVYDRRFEYKDLAHITSEQAAQLNNVIVEEGDVFINITGASVARSCIVPSNILPARVNQHVAIVRCNHSQLQPVFVNNMFLNEHFKEELLDIGESGGATRQAITKQQLENLVVILPPLALQNQFADFVAQVDKSKFACALTMHFYQTLQNSLRQEWMRCQTLNF